MYSNMKADVLIKDSRGSSYLAKILRSQIEKGDIPGGGFLPSERALAKAHLVGNLTARRALKLLEAEAWVAAEDRRGYRVLARANDPDRGCPLAFVVSQTSNISYAPFSIDVLTALQTAAGRQKWSLLGVQREGRSVGEVVEHLRAARTCGAIVDTLDTDLLEQVRRLGIPVVMADAWIPDAKCDAVAQDGFTGGLLAAEWLASRGHRKIAFFGPSLHAADMLTVERYAGAVGGLARAGLALDPALSVHVLQRNKEAEIAQARELLSRRDRPTGVLALWQGLGLAVARAARELGLVIGKDLDLVGWTVSEGVSADVLQDFADLGASGVAVVVCDPAELAELCMVRLMQRRAAPRLPFSLTRVPVRLRLPGENDK